MSESNLLPCPFCGDDVQLLEHTDCLSATGEVFISCCSRMSESFVLDEYEPSKKDSKQAAFNSITKDWNYRAKVSDRTDKQNTKLKARVARLESALKDAIDIAASENGSTAEEWLDVGRADNVPDFITAFNETLKQSLVEIQIDGIYKFMTEAETLINKEPDALHRVMMIEFIDNLRESVEDDE